MAQNSSTDRLSELVNRVDSLVAHHVSYQPINTGEIFTGNMNELFISDYTTSDSYEVKVIEAEQEKLARDLGLDLNAGYLENLEQGVFNVEGIFYRRRAQMELEWDILNNGYLDNRHEIRELENEKKIARFEHSNRYKADEIDSLRFAFKKYFNQREASIIRNYLKMLEDRHQVAVELYELNYKPWEEVIEITSMRAQAQVELDNLLAVNRQFADIELAVSEGAALPLLNIDLNKLLEAGQFETLQDSIFSEQIGKINNEYNAWRDISLSTFVRYNYYNSSSDINLSSINNREYFSVGLNISVPLPLLRSNNNKIAEARENQLNAELTRSKNKSRQDLYADYSRYQDKLQEYVESYKDYLQLQTRIDKQHQREALNDPSYSPLVVFELLTKRVETARALLDAKQDMYEILVSLKQQVPGSEFNEFLFSVDPDSYFSHKQSISSTAAYLWSATFAKVSNENLIDYLSEKQIDRVLLSTGVEPSLKEKAASFIELAGTKGLQVELMIGDNNLLLPGHEEEMANIFKEAKALNAAGVHLDVEPHVRNDWDSRKEEYKDLYLQLIKRADKLAESQGVSLSISIPVFYDSIISKLKTYTDTIFVMAYGINSIDKLKEKLKDELEATGETLTISLRPDDFENLEDLESFITDMKDETGIKAVALHDIESLMKLDNIEVTLNNYEE
ncbi:MAG: TolC family protein [Candidatus Halalkalibacterium sp. M3_1C_030]